MKSMSLSSSPSKKGYGHSHDNGSSFAEQLAQQFANSAPSFPDPEDDIGNETIAKITTGATGEGEDVQPPSALRRKSNALLADEDRKYAGVTVSRKSLLSDEESIGSDLEQNDGSDFGDNSDMESDEIDYDFIDHKTGESRNAKSINIDSEEDEELGSDNSNSEADDEDSSYYNQFDMDLSAFAKGTRLADTTAEDSDLEENSDESSQEDGVTTLKTRQQDDEVKRGQAVQNQIKLWETLLELRIELQKLLNSSNQLPQGGMWQQLQAVDSEDQQRIPHHEITQACDSCLNLTEELDSLQSVLEGAPPPTSGTKRSMEDMEDRISKRFKTAQTSRNDVIQKWDDKTRLSVAASSKRRSLDHSQQTTLSQIEYILSDRERLLLRTRQKRNNLKVIGQVEKKKQLEKGDEVEVDDKDLTTENDRKKAAQSHSIDPEIFNDDDFYHQLLRELIEQRTNRSDDPIAMSRQWLEFQALRKQIKRTIDTRASKGRKLRYNVMPKLVNFMAPIITSLEWDDDRKDELFASLFGKKPEYKVVEAVEPSDVVILR